MSDVGRYRRVFTRLWLHPGFKSLSPAGRILALYLLTGPQSNRIGLFHFSLARAAEDLKASTETLRTGLSNVAETFGWMFDATASVVYIPSWWRWNKPENRNVLEGNLKDLNEVPPCGLVEAFARNLRWLPATSHPTFLECIGIRLGERPPTQDQDQRSGSGKQEQDRTLRAVPSGARSAPSASPSENPRSVNADEEALLSGAREVLRLTDPNASTDHLLDVLADWNRRRATPLTYSSEKGIEFLAIARSELRMASTARGKA